MSRRLSPCHDPTLFCPKIRKKVRNMIFLDGLSLVIRCQRCSRRAETEAEGPVSGRNGAFRHVVGGSMPCSPSGGVPSAVPAMIFLCMFLPFQLFSAMRVSRVCISEGRPIPCGRRAASGCRRFSMPMVSGSTAHFAKGSDDAVSADVKTDPAEQLPDPFSFCRKRSVTR